MINIRRWSAKGSDKSLYLLDLDPHDPSYHQTIISALKLRLTYFKEGTIPRLGKYSLMESFNPCAFKSLPDPRWNGSQSTHEGLRINIRLLDSGRSYQTKAWYGEGKILSSKSAANWHLKEFHYDVKKLYEIIIDRASSELKEKLIKLGEKDIKLVKSGNDMSLTRQRLISERNDCYRSAYHWAFAEYNSMFMSLKRFDRRVTENPF